MKSTQLVRALSWLVLIALVGTMAPPALSSTDGFKQQDGGVTSWSGAALAEGGAAAPATSAPMEVAPLGGSQVV